MRLLKGDKELIDRLYSAGKIDVNDELLQRYAGGYDKAVMQVFGNGKYPELADKLRINASRWATRKTYDLCQKLEQAKASGMSPEAFKKFAAARISVYNAYQKTEYNTLVARCRTAKQFTQFQQDADVYPNLEWIATRSATPRAEHVGYTGLILPIDDPFWNTNQPGNEYNCKCDWRQTSKPAGVAPKKATPPARGLEGNPAGTGEAITERHPYFERTKNAPKWVDDKAMLQLPDEVAFVKKITPEGFEYFEHRLVDGTAEAEGNRIIASLLAKNGYRDIRLLPQIGWEEKALRARYFGIDYAKTHYAVMPDAMIDGSIVEFKGVNVNKFTTRIGKAAKQSDIAFIRLTEIMQDDTLKLKIDKQWTMTDRKNLKQIIVYNNGKLHIFNRK